MSVEVHMQCEVCHTPAPLPRAYSRKSRWGTLRLQAVMPDGWRVDGGGAYCPRHAQDALGPERIKDSWTEHDLRQAYATVQEHEDQIERCRGCP